MPDSTSMKYAFQFLGGFPTWVFMIMLLIAAITTIIVVTSKTGVLNKLMDFYTGLQKNNADSQETAKLVKAIRDDQLLSNRMREQQGYQISGIIERMDTLENRLIHIERSHCTSSATCPNATRD